MAMQDIRVSLRLSKVTKPGKYLHEMSRLSLQGSAIARAACAAECPEAIYEEKARVASSKLQNMKCQLPSNSLLAAMSWLLVVFDAPDPSNVHIWTP